jgi:hypothetical protein
MTDKKKYYKLDEIGFVATQKRVPAIVRKRIEKKTGDIFQAARVTSASSSSKVKKRPKLFYLSVC